MDSICRLCCSTNFVNNHIFDEENALNLKMELFLPIKVIKDDLLPQKVCNRCSCRVNDIYQFCNIAIEAQDRLRSMLLQVSNDANASIDLTLTKHEAHLPDAADADKVDQSTQTDDIDSHTKLERLKDEPKSHSPSPIKMESATESDDWEAANVPSDSSDNISLIALKKKKRGRKPNATNGETPVKKTRKKKPKLKEWEIIMNALPGGTAITLVPSSDSKADVKREELEIETDYLEAQPMLKTTVEVKKEPADEDLHQCCICFTQCYSKCDMLQHYRQHAAADGGTQPPPPPVPSPPRCTRCRKLVEGGAGEWALHWARHWERDARPFRCALCEKAFRDPHQIFKHGQTHKTGEGATPPSKRFICDLCPEGFVYMRYLLSHRVRAHPEAAHRPLALRCAVCSRTFAHLNSLRRHLRAHSGERNHLCSVCGKALSSREHLKFHLRIHSGYKPNVCKTCGKGFVKKCNLTLHERVHSGEKPHVCSHCGKAFSQRSTLVIHERYHSGARPYSCGLCGRGFVAKGLLSMHLKTTCI